MRNNFAISHLCSSFRFAKCSVDCPNAENYPVQDILDIQALLSKIASYEMFFKSVLSFFQYFF